VAGTYDGANLRVYVNGVLAGTTASSRSVPGNSEPVLIGWTYSGNIDEVAIYSSVLSAQKITEHYNAGRR
jgi:hypothetical protein